MLNKETQVSHLPNLQLWGLWWVPVIRDVKIRSPQSVWGRLVGSMSHAAGVSSAYKRPHVLFGSLMLFSGALLPPNHFLVAVNRERLKPFLEISCG